MEGSFPGASPAEVSAWEKDKYDAGSWNPVDGTFPTPGMSSRPLPFRSRRPSPARRRRETLPKARAISLRTRTWTTPSGVQRAGIALRGNYLYRSDSPKFAFVRRAGTFAVTAQLSGRVATSQPRTDPGIHEPSSRLCCPGGSVCKSIDWMRVRAEAENGSARGGVRKHPSSPSHPVPFWLKCGPCWTVASYSGAVRKYKI